MKATKKAVPVSKALEEVWEWKIEVYKDINNLSFEEKKEYFDKRLKEAVKILKGKLTTNPDGSYLIKRKTKEHSGKKLQSKQ